MKYQVSLYYKYITIEDPEAFARERLTFCKSLSLKGRILVATEGVNGTLSDTVEETEKYMEAMQADRRFKDTLSKIDPAEEMVFRKMSVRPRSELVALSLGEDVSPLEATGKYSEPAEFRGALLDEDIVVIGARNDYEYDLGHFRGAVHPDARNFRELPQWIHKNKEQSTDRKIVTYCTDGVCCEKFSGWLLKEGFEDAAQLRSDITNYGKNPETRGELWDGKVYVFDDRISVEINHIDKEVTRKDWFDGTPRERYTNRASLGCNRQILAPKENEHKHLGGCSLECSQHPTNRYVKKYNLTEVKVAECLASLEAAET